MKSFLKALVAHLAPQEPKILRVEEDQVLLNAKSEETEALQRLCRPLREGTTVYSTDAVEFTVKGGTPVRRGALPPAKVEELKPAIKQAWLDRWDDEPPFQLTSA